MTYNFAQITINEGQFWQEGGYCTLKTIKETSRLEIIARIIDVHDRITEKVLFTWPTDNIVYSHETPTSCLKYPGLEIRLDQKRILHNGVDIALTKYEYGILKLLASHPGWVYSKEHIFTEVWQADSETCFSSVTNTISRIRQKIEPDKSNPVYIKTVFGRGYMFALKPIY